MKKARVNVANLALLSRPEFARCGAGVLRVMLIMAALSLRCEPFARLALYNHSRGVEQERCLGTSVLANASSWGIKILHVDGILFSQQRRSYCMRKHFCSLVKHSLH